MLSFGGNPRVVGKSRTISFGYGFSFFILHFSFFTLKVEFLAPSISSSTYQKSTPNHVDEVWFPPLHHDDDRTITK